MPAGRPPQPVPQDLADHIVERVGQGVPLAQVVRENPRLPTVSGVTYWLEKDKEFAARYARARVIGYDAIAAEMLRIADTPLEGIKRKITEDGVEITEEDMLGHRKLQVDTRRWLLSKWDPKRYGERLELAGDPEAPLEVIDRNERDTARRIALALALGLKAQREQAIEGESTPVFEPIAHSAQDDIDDLI